MPDRVEYHYTIKELPSSERPRERLLKYGAQNLPTSDLLAIVMRTGVQGENVVHLAERLMGKYQTLTALARAEAGELTEVAGIGEAKVAEIKAALELGKRLQVEAPEERAQIRSPADAAHLVIPTMSLLEQEELHVLLLDTKNRVLATEAVARGSLNVTHVQIAGLFRKAIRHGQCAAIILVHNHPSGDPTPSPDDVAVTKQVVEAGKLLDIEVLDHLVIGGQRFVSLKERGLGFA